MINKRPLYLVMKQVHSFIVRRENKQYSCVPSSSLPGWPVPTSSGVLGDAFSQSLTKVIPLLYSRPAADYKNSSDVNDITK